MFDLRQKIKIYIFILLWLIYTVLHIIAVYSALPDVGFGNILIHSIVQTILLALLLFLLNLVFEFGHFEHLPHFQRLINLTALYLLMAGVWFGVGYIIDLIVLGMDNSNEFINVFPFYGIISILFFIVIYSKNRLKSDTIDEEENISPSEEEPDDDNPVNDEPEFLERIAVKQGTKVNVISIDDVFYFQADGDYVQIHSKNGKFLKEQTMKYFQEHLLASQFVRIHRSTIVNVTHIVRIELFEKQQQRLILKNGESLKISVTGNRLLRQTLGL